MIDSDCAPQLFKSKGLSGMFYSKESQTKQNKTKQRRTRVFKGQNPFAKPECNNNKEKITINGKH